MDTIKLPDGYDFRYTLSFLISVKSLLEQRGKMEIVEELSSKLSAKTDTKLGIDMLNKYIGEKGEKWGTLSEERRQVMATYFGLDDPELIITEKYQ